MLHTEERRSRPLRQRLGGILWQESSQAEKRSSSNSQLHGQETEGKVEEVAAQLDRTSRGL
jgi:hypothetical protein